VADSTFTYVTYIRTTPARLWKALTKVEAFGACCMGTRFESDWKAGSAWRGVGPDGTLYDSGKVLESVPGKRLVLRWQSEWRADFKAEGPSRLVYKMEPARKAVKFTLTHSIGRQKSKFIASVSEAWPMVASNLKSLLETGKVALSDNPRHKH
jgi:uncharacterized protein YndB with AHSA1/START domain